MGKNKPPELVIYILPLLKTSSSDDSLHRIQQIQTLLAQNTEKRETLTMLMT